MIHFLQARYRWVLIFWIFLVSAVAYLDRVNVSIAKRAIAGEFQLDNTHLGWVFTAFLLGYAFFQAPAGRLADRIGPRLIIMLGVIWWGIFTVLITVIPPRMAGVLPLLITIRFCLGIGESVVYPASNSVVARWIPSSERGIANGLIFAGVGFGAGITAPLVNYIVTHQGWRAAFWVSAAIGLTAGVIWYVLARDTPAQHPLVTPEERNYIEEGLPPSQPRAEKLPWSYILSLSDLWAVTFSYFAYGYAAQIFFNWFFSYLSDVRGLDLKQSSYYTMLPFIAMSIGSIVGGIISDRLTKSYGTRIGRCGIAVVGIGLSAVFIALGTQVGSPQLASIILAGGAGSLYLSQSSFWSVSADIGGKSAGSVSGFMNMGGQLGGALTASLTPVIAQQFGWSASFLVASILCAAGAIAWLFVGRSSSAIGSQTRLATVK